MDRNYKYCLSEVLDQAIKLYSSNPPTRLTNMKKIINCIKKLFAKCNCKEVIKKEYVIKKINGIKLRISQKIK